MPDSFEKKPVGRDNLGGRELPVGIPRFVEVVLSFAGLVAVSPVLVVCAVAIFLTSKGSVLFRQLRVGRHGQVFLLYKFRTMVIKSRGSLITADNDQRVTPVGRILRKTKLDELPELFNVLIGDMSFVGPRPEVSEFVDMSNPLWRRVLNARPGITDPVTLRLRNEEEFLAKVEDKETFYRDVIQPFKLHGSIEYLEKKSFSGDVQIIAKTLKVIAFPKTAPPPTVEDVKLSYVE